MNNECEPMKSNLRDEIKHMMDECDIIVCTGNQWMSVVKNGWDCYSKDKIVVTKSN
jgi:TPP-dependent 2-oxoacid decarboxylase